MTIVYRSEKGAPLTNNEVDGNFRDLDQRVDANQQAASNAHQAADDAQGAAEAAGGAAVAVGQALDTHKASGDHDIRYLRRDVSDTAPLLSGIPEGGIVGLPGDLDVLRTAVQRLQYGDGPFPALDLQFVGAKRLDPRAAFTRPTDGWCVGERGLLVQALPNEPRFDYDPETGRARGLLMESEGTNLALYSNFQPGDSWAGNALRELSANVGRSPNGDGTLSRLSTNAEGIPYAAPGSVSYTAGTKYVAHCWFRFNPAANSKWVRLLMHATAFGTSKLVLFNIQTGEVKVDPSQWIPEQWGFIRFPGNMVLVWHVNTATATASTYAPMVWLHDSIAVGEGVDFWGIDVKAGSSLSSYVPTRGAAASRAEDRMMLSGANFTDWFNPSEGTLMIEADTSDDTEGQGGTRRLVSLSDGTNANRMDIYLNSINRMTAFISAGATTANISQSVTIARNTPFRFGVAYKEGRYACVTNGGAVVVDSSGVNPAGLSQLRLGYSTVTGHWNGHIRRLTYFPRQLSDSELQGITAL